ncbi:MAG: DUF1801 domain-containing protein [Candidatus Saccharimonadales bacterium]
MSRADERHDITVQEYIASIEDETVQKDAIIIFDLMHNISGEEPILYGIGTIGFGIYTYEYASGRKGESHTLGFYPRKGKTTIYLTDGTNRYTELLSKLGNQTSTGYCIYIKQLRDINLDILQEIIEKSYANVVAKSRPGPVTKILWQSEE